MPEWYGVILALAGFSLLGLIWPPLLGCLALLGAALGVSIGQALSSASRARWPGGRAGWRERGSRFLLTAFLHLLQPLARLSGRLRHGLTPWRRRGPELAIVLPGSVTLWSETWQAPEAWLTRIRQTVAGTGAVVVAGGDFDRWDLEARGGALGSARLCMATEEHGAGRQLLRFRLWPRFSRSGGLAALFLGPGRRGRGGDQAWAAALILTACALLLVSRMLVESAAAVAVLRRAIGQVEKATASTESFLIPDALDAMSARALD